jgi:hypothetical protein
MMMNNAKLVETTDLNLTISVHELDAIRCEAIRMRETASNDSTQWLESVGGIENLSANECFYEILFASNPSVRTPTSHGYEMIGWSGLS